MSLAKRFSRIRDSYQMPKYPIVLCHGFSGFDKVALFKRPRLFHQAEKVEKALTQHLVELDYWRGIRETLEQRGARVLTGRVPPFGTIQERATALERFIEEQIKGEAFKSREKGNSDEEPVLLNLISHSMGGLDCRYMISKLGSPRYKVKSLTTVSTPHRGSECADYAVELVQKFPALNTVCPRSVYELTSESMARFNEEVRDDPSVEYMSYGAQFQPQWYNVFNLTWHIMHKRSGCDNDGMVSTDSAHWGKYMGTLDGVDHLDLINWTNTMRRGLEKVAGEEQEAFDATALYLEIAEGLARRGL